MIKFLLTLIVALLGVHETFAATYYASNDVQIAQVINTLQPGDTLWIKAGDYGPIVCTARGTREKPIQVRAQAGARVTLSSTNKFALTAYSEYVWYRGFELTGYSGLWASEIDTSYYRGNRYINLVIHDTQITQAINNFNGGSEFYGCIVYNAHEGYAIYAHNKLGPQPRYKILEDCVFFDNTGSSGGRGMQVQLGSGGGAGMENIRFRGNVIFNADLRYGKMETAAVDPTYGSYMNGVFSDNNLYNLLWWQFGRLSRNMLIERNWLIYVGNLEFWGCDANTGPNVVVRSNVYTGQLSIDCPGVTSVNNQKVTTLAGQHVFIRPNQYADTNDLKVGHVVVYTFNGAPTVQINVSSLLETGAVYTVRDVQNYYGTPVATGAYTGSITVVLPGTDAPSPRVERPAIPDWPVVARHTSQEFNCFVIERMEAQITPPIPPIPPTPVTNIVVITNYVWVTNYQVMNVTNAVTNTVWQFISPVMTTNLATP